MTKAWVDQVAWNADGLVPAIAQEEETGTVLMLAWMNRESLAKTLETGKAVYWSRSRNQLWSKGEISGHFQEIVDIRLDCDRDALLLTVRQKGGVACHTGRHHCFFHHLEGGRWVETGEVIIAPEEMYQERGS